MNKNIKTLINALPIILVPLFTERKRIKEHPEMEKLSDFSTTAYHNVKDKGEDAYHSVKDTSVSIYRTGRSAAGTVGSKISDKRQERAYNKDVKSYQRSVKREDKLLAQFEKDKEKHRQKRMEAEMAKDTVVPKIMQSGQVMSNEDKMAGMTVSKDLISEGSNIHHQTEAALETNIDNHGIAQMYDEDQPMSRVSLSKKDEKRLNIDDQRHDDEKNDRMDSNETDYSNDEENYMTSDVQQLYFDKTKGHQNSIEDYEPAELFKKHHETLDPTVNYDKPSDKASEGEGSLFDRHRAAAEVHISEHGRKTGIKNNMTKNKKQQKLEKKIDKKRQQF